MQGQSAGSIGLSGILSSIGDGLPDLPLIVWTLVVLISALAAFAVLRGLIFPEARTSPQGAVDCSFTFDGRSLMSVSGPGQQQLNRGSSIGEPLEQLKSIFDDDELSLQIDTLIGEGTGFSRRVHTVDGQMMEVRGHPVGGMARISMKTAEGDTGGQAASLKELRDLRRETAMLRAMLDAAPGLNMTLDDRGGLVRMNDRLARAGDAAEALKQTKSERICLADAGDEDHWYMLNRTRFDDGCEAVFATPIDTLVSAEQSLANFVSTLTETFAHLTTGLAIFDSEGLLSLFNPALSDLTGVDPTRLIAQPTIRTFLELLRDQRMVPEQRDFNAWRQTITRLERGAREGTYREDWTLPSGRVFRVIGRPHPNGAVALIFEDISSTVTLERRYRDEIELGQAALDRISDAVAIFDTGGSLVFANNAFDDLWQIDTMSTLEAPDIAQMTRRWTEACLPTPVWGRLRSFVTSEQSRTSWQSEVSTRAGRHLQAQFSPLPNGSTLTVFSHSRTSAGTLAEEAVPDGARDALLSLISEDLATVTAGAAPETARAGTIGLLRSLIALPGRGAEQDAESLAGQLRDFAAGRDRALVIGDWVWQEPRAVPQADATLVWTVLLSALEAAGHGGTGEALRLSVTQAAGGLHIRAEGPGLSADTDTLPLRYLKRLAARSSAAPALTVEPGRLDLRCPAGAVAAGETGREAALPSA